MQSPDTSHILSLLHTQTIPWCSSLQVKSIILIHGTESAIVKLKSDAPAAA